MGVPVPLDRAAAMYRDVVPAGGGGTLQERREGFEAMLARLPIPADAAITAGSLGGVEGYWVRAAGAASGRVGVMLHGGGYTMGSAKGYRAYAAEVSRVTKARVFVPEYRLAPEHPFPAAIEDARSVLSAAMDEAGPQSCFATGDSAGGGLVLSALWELRLARDAEALSRFRQGSQSKADGAARKRESSNTTQSRPEQFRP